MKLHVLGCGDAFGSGGRNQSAYLVDAGDRLFLLDCGATTLGAMKRAGFDPRRLDAIILSHLHGDHFAGVPFFFLEDLYLRSRPTPLIVAGPPGAEARVRGLFNLMYGGGDVKNIPPTTFKVLRPGEPALIAGVQVFPFQVPHQTNEISLGLRVAYAGKQILFSGDSLWTEAFIEQARGVDLFLCECSFYIEQPGMHVNYHTLTANLSRLECQKILLTHLGDAMLERRGELAVAAVEDGMVIAI